MGSGRGPHSIGDIKSLIDQAKKELRKVGRRTKGIYSLALRTKTSTRLIFCAHKPKMKIPRLSLTTGQYLSL